ncbi:MAG: response regulator [Flavisolibacter sp.]
MKRKHRIVIVDDDADDREIIRDAFEKSIDEQEYVFFENGDMLIEHLHHLNGTGTPSLIMLDLNMPGKDGRETLKEIKTDNRLQHIPVIVFTTSSSTRDIQTVYDMGANCFITKPDTFNKLTELAAAITKLWLP